MKRVDRIETDLWIGSEKPITNGTHCSTVGALPLEAIKKATFHREESVNGAIEPECVGMPGWKRALDICCILLASPIVLPLMAVVAGIIKLVSPGPALFRQERIGYLGRRFTCFKFRTMIVNADTGVHQGHLNRLMTSNLPMKKLDSAGDKRLIPFGILLRATGLDELPQIFNVLRGEMSLVGPRPCVPYEYAAYTPRHRQRFQAVPGLTGLWQVNGKNSTTFEEMIDYDIGYAQQKSLLLDLTILFKTVPAILGQARDIRRDKRSGFQKPSLERR